MCVGQDDILVLCKPTSLGEDVEFNLKIISDFSWTLRSFRQLVDISTCYALQTLPSTLSSVANVGSIITTLENCIVCAGNDDEKFSELAKVRRGTFKDQSGKIHHMTVQSCMPYNGTLCVLVIIIYRYSSDCNCECTWVNHSPQQMCLLNCCS